MSGLDTIQVQCPCCWENFAAVIDCSVTDQTYVEDCYVCCRPLIFRVQTDGSAILNIEVTAEND